MSLFPGNPMSATLLGRFNKYRVCCLHLDGSVKIFSCRTIAKARRIAAANFCTCNF